MLQTSYEGQPAVGAPGQPVHLGGFDTISRKNTSKGAKVVTVTPAGVAATLYTLIINDRTITFTSVAGTAAEIVTGLTNAIIADGAAYGIVIPTGTTTLILTGRNVGEDFTVDDSDTNLTAVITTAVNTGTSLRFGTWTMQATVAADADQPTSVLKVMTAVPVQVNSIIYTLEVQLLDGSNRGYEAVFTSDGSATVKEILDALVLILEAKLPANTVSVTEDDATMTFTAELPGFNFEVNGGSASATGVWTIATTTTNGRGGFTRRLLGVLMHDDTQGTEPSVSGGTATASTSYRANAAMRIGERGEIYLLLDDGVTVAAGDRVWVRTTAAATEVLGASSNAVDGTDNVQLLNVYFTGANTSSDASNFAPAQLNALP